MKKKKTLFWATAIMILVNIILCISLDNYLALLAWLCSAAYLIIAHTNDLFADKAYNAYTNLWDSYNSLWDAYNRLKNYKNN